MGNKIERCAVCQGFTTKTILGFCGKCAKVEIKKLKAEAEQAIRIKDEATLVNRNKRLRILMKLDPVPTTTYDTALFGTIKEGKDE